MTGYSDTYDPNKYFLLPCPFCGSNKVQLDDCAWGQDLTADGEFGFQAVCFSCGTTGPSNGKKGEALSMKRAANAWNRRK